MEKIFAVKYFDQKYLRINEFDYYERTSSKAEATTFEKFENAKVMVDIINGQSSQIKCRVSTWQVSEVSHPIDLIDTEWLEAFIAEEKAVYNEYPSEQRILDSWERNKEYFYHHKGKPNFYVDKTKHNKSDLDSTWSKLSKPVKTIMERVDINKHDLVLEVGKELDIPYFKGVITQQIVDEIKWLEKEEKEGHFRTEQVGNVLTIRFLKSAF